MQDWFVKDGVIGFKGEGYNNICTIKDYGDFEMIVDWKITNGGSWPGETLSLSGTLADGAVFVVQEG